MPPRRIIRDPLKGTEFGGVDGLVQPPPHDWTNRPREVLIAIHQRDTVTEPDIENLNGVDMKDPLIAPSTDHYRGRIPLPEPQEVIEEQQLIALAQAIAEAVDQAIANQEAQRVSDDGPIQA